MPPNDERQRRVVLRRRQERARLTKGAEDWMRAALAPKRTTQTAEIAVGVIPTNDATTSRLPNTRRRRLTEHVRKLVDTIEQSDSARTVRQSLGRQDAEFDEPETPILEHACATCRGHCCQTGGDHAYLDSTDVARFWATRPNASGASIVRAYVAALPPRSYAGSCVFHGSAGCTLRREMRANLCNVFLCDGARELRSRAEQTPTHGAFLVATKDGELRRATYVDEAGGARRIRKP